MAFARVPPPPRQAPPRIAKQHAPIAMMVRRPTTGVPEIALANLVFGLMEWNSAE